MEMSWGLIPASICIAVFFLFIKYTTLRGETFHFSGKNSFAFAFAALFVAKTHTFETDYAANAKCNRGKVG